MLNLSNAPQVLSPYPLTFDFMVNMVFEKPGMFIWKFGPSSAFWYMNFQILIKWERIYRIPYRTLVLSYIGSGGGGGGRGALECQGGYQAHPKIPVITVIFQYQALYARTSFRGAKTCKIGKKAVFLVILTNFGNNMTGYKM